MLRDDGRASAADGCCVPCRRKQTTAPRRHVARGGPNQGADREERTAAEGRRGSAKRARQIREDSPRIAQTPSDQITVAALPQHASEVSDVVTDGIAASTSSAQRT